MLKFRQIFDIIHIHVGPLLALLIEEGNETSHRSLHRINQLIAMTTLVELVGEFLIDFSYLIPFLGLDIASALLQLTDNFMVVVRKINQGNPTEFSLILLLLLKSEILIWNVALRGKSHDSALYLSLEVDPELTNF